MLIGILMLGLPVPALAAEVSGNWITQDKSAIVTISECGTSLCGSIARILVQRADIPKNDIHNPDPARRAYPLNGLRILSGFMRKGTRWEGGRIYDPKTGKSYASKLRLNADGSLGVSGCISIICRTQRWTRAR